MINKRYVIGIDFGSDSARALLLDSANGTKLAEASSLYPRWGKKKYCNEELAQYRQHPQDYIDALESVLGSLVTQVDSAVTKKVVGISVGTTGSTVCPVDRKGVALALIPEFAEDPDAMFHLWKDHTAVAEAKEITSAFSTGDVDYTKFQGEYSAEWFWAKILHTTRKNSKVKNSAYNWVEQCDWIAGVLADKLNPKEMVYCACAAGHKALWNSSFGGLPERRLLFTLDPYLGQIYDMHSRQPKNAGSIIGQISGHYANLFGLNEKAIVATGSLDAHAGAVGVGIGENTLVKVMGTSTVDMFIVKDKDIDGINIQGCCGTAENSIIPGYLGCEAGQSAFGDIYVWYRKILMWGLNDVIIPEEIICREKLEIIKNYLSSTIICELEKHIKYDSTQSLIALDWFNGRRYPKLNERVTGAIMGLSLATKAPDIYCAIARATVFGSKRIFDSFINAGIRIDKIICVGGVATKSDYLMQMLSDVLNLPIMVSGERQGCALGACIYAAVGAGVYSTIQEAQKQFCEPYSAKFFPKENMHAKYMLEYDKYLSLGEYVEYHVSE